MNKSQPQYERSWQSVFKFVVCTVLAISSLLMLCFSLLSFETIRSFLDRYSGDGSADSFIPERHAKFIVASQFFGLFMALLSILFWLIPVQFWLKLWKHLEFSKRIRSSLRWWRIICRGEFKWLAGMALFAAALRLPSLNDPIRYDEAHTYLSYAKYPWFVIISVYDDPNNHIFHTLLVRLSASFFGNAEWVIRLPAFLTGTALVPLTFLAGKAIAGRQAAIAASTVVAVSSAMIEYSVLGRGYSLICCFTMLNLIFCLRILRGDPGLEWGLLTLSSALGMWTVPVMVYPNLITWGWLLLSKLSPKNLGHSNLRSLLHWASWVGMTGILTTLLYLPVVVNTGLASLNGQGFAQPLTFAPLITHIFTFNEAQEALLLRDWSLPSLAGLTICFLAGIRNGFKKDQQRWTAILVALFGCLLFIFWQRVTPPARVGLFMLPLLSLPIGSGFAALLRSQRNSKRKYIWSLWLIFVVYPPVLNEKLTGSIRSSEETGICPEAEEIIQILKSEDWFWSEDSSPLIAVSPASAPIVYYAERSGLSLLHFKLPEVNSIQDAVVIVSHLNDQSVGEVLDQLHLNDDHIAVRFQLWQRRQTVSLYRYVK